MVTFTVKPGGEVQVDANAYHDAPANLLPEWICGKPHALSVPSGLDLDTRYALCVAPRGDHRKHPLARCFAKLTPCQILLHAPLTGYPVADTVENWLYVVKYVAGKRLAMKMDGERERL